MTRSILKIHPLQRLSSPSRGVSALVHLGGLASFFWSFKYILDNPNRASESYGGNFQYLTIIGLALATLTFTFGFFADATLSGRLFLFKNFLSICSTPLEVLISLLYWGICAIDKRLVVPEEDALPIHANISVHAIPAIVLTIDFLFISPPWTIAITPALGLSTTIAFGYWFWIEQCFKHNGWYPYPILGQLPFEGRIGLFVLSAVVMTLNTAALKWFYGRVNGFGSPQKQPVPQGCEAER